MKSCRGSEFSDDQYAPLLAFFPLGPGPLLKTKRSPEHFFLKAEEYVFKKSRDIRSAFLKAYTFSPGVRPSA